MFSARFNGGEVEQRMRKVHRILQDQGFEVLMVAADAGEDFGRQTSALLGKLLSRRGILLAVCTSDYAEKTSSKYSSHEELRTAYDNDLDIIPLRVEDTYPPRPPAGKKHPYDPDEEALGLIAMALPRGRVFIDCRSLSPEEIAERIAKRLRKASTAQVPVPAASPATPAASSSQGTSLASGSSAGPLAGPAGSALRSGKLAEKALVPSSLAAEGSGSATTGASSHVQAAPAGSSEGTLATGLAGESFTAAAAQTLPPQADSRAEQDAEQEEEEAWAGAKEWQLEATFQGHAKDVRALAALDAQTLASASEDHTVKLWDLAARRCTATLTGHTNEVLALCRLSGTALASGSGDNAVRVWDVPTSRCLATLQGHTSWVRATCRLSEQTVASASDDNSVKVWDVRTSGCVATLTGHTNWVRALCVPSEGVVASGSRDTTVRLWEAAAGFRCRAILERHTGSVYALCPLAGGGLASGDVDGRVRFWEPGGARSLEVHAAFFSGGVWALCRLGTGAVASGGHHDRHVRVWDSASGARLGELDTGRFVYALCRVEGTALATSGGHDVCLWRGR